MKNTLWKLKPEFRCVFQIQIKLLYATTTKITSKAFFDHFNNVIYLNALHFRACWFFREYWLQYL